MKYLILIASAFILVSCGNKEKEDESFSTEKKEEVTETEDQVAGSFRNIDINVEENPALIEGDARVTDNIFYYQLEQGGSVLVEEKKVTLDETKDGWGNFEIELDITDEMVEHEETPILVLYVKGADNEVVNPNNIPIDLTMMY